MNWASYQHGKCSFFARSRFCRLNGFIVALSIPIHLFFFLSHQRSQFSLGGLVIPDSEWKNKIDVSMATIAHFSQDFGNSSVVVAIDIFINLIDNFGLACYLIGSRIVVCSSHLHVIQNYRWLVFGSDFVRNVLMLRLSGLFAALTTKSYPFRMVAPFCGIVVGLS